MLRELLAPPFDKAEDGPLRASWFCCMSCVIRHYESKCSNRTAFSRATFQNTVSLIRPDCHSPLRKSTSGVGVAGAQMSVPNSKRSWNSVRNCTA